MLLPIMKTAKRLENSKLLKDRGSKVIPLEN